MDLTKGKISSGLFIFALPVIGSLIFQQLYNTVDTIIVGYYLGDRALASMGATSAIYELLVGFSLGIGNGMSLVIGRCFGAGKMEKIKDYVFHSIILGIIISLMVTFIGLIFLRPLLSILRTPGEVMEGAYSYIKVISAGVILMFIYNLSSSYLRIIGNSLMPFIFLVVSSLINIILDIYFITLLKWGIEGAALATIISQGISGLLCIIYIFLKVKILIPERGNYKMHRAYVRELLNQGIAMGLMSSLVSIGSIILQYGINTLGYLVIAGHTASRKLFILFGIPFDAMAISLAAFVSQNRGAGENRRIRKAMRIAIEFDVAVTLLITIIIWLYSGNLIAIVTGTQSENVIRYGALNLNVIAPFYAVLGILIQTRYSLQAIGVKNPAVFSSIIELVGKIIFVIFLIPIFKYYGVVFCEPIIWIFMAIYLSYKFYNEESIKIAYAGK